MKDIYETTRLLLKRPGAKDVEKILDFQRRNRDFLSEWEPEKSADFYSSKFQSNLLMEEKKRMENEEMLKLYIFKKENQQKIIGSITFNNIIKGAFCSCHLGYKMDKDELNNGYITEVIEKGIQIIFDDYKLHRIEANIMPKNSPSLRVVEKLGFYNEGLAFQYLKINGKWEDHIHMVLLNENV